MRTTYMRESRICDNFAETINFVNKNEETTLFRHVADFCGNDGRIVPYVLLGRGRRARSRKIGAGNLRLVAVAAGAEVFTPLPVPVFT